MGMACKALDEARVPAWDDFVRTMPGGTFFHLAAWRQVIAHAFGHRTYYVLTERDGAITGVLPLVHMKTRLFGNMLISNPFCVYGGPLAADAESAAALHEHAAWLMSRLGAMAVEFRFLGPVESDWLARPDLYVTFRKPIAPDDAANMKAIPRKQRAMVRKGIQNGLTSVVSTEHVDQFHRIYAESVRNLGTPVFSRVYFRLLVTTFRDCCDIVTVLNDGRPIAAVLNFYFSDQVLPYYGGGKAVARSLAANDFMYWEVMRRAAARGFRLFDFGRSKLGTGACAFKQNWGFAPEKLHYRYKLRPGASIPDYNPLNPKYRLMIAVWKRLPLPLAGLIGPHIVRGIG